MASAALHALFQVIRNSLAAVPVTSVRVLRSIQTPKTSNTRHSGKLHAYRSRSIPCRHEWRAAAAANCSCWSRSSSSKLMPLDSNLLAFFSRPCNTSASVVGRCGCSAVWYL